MRSQHVHIGLTSWCSSQPAMEEYLPPLCQHSKETHLPVRLVIRSCTNTDNTSRHAQYYVIEHAANPDIYIELERISQTLEIDLNHLDTTFLDEDGGRLGDTAQLMWRTQLPCFDAAIRTAGGGALHTQRVTEEQFGRAVLDRYVDRFVRVAVAPDTPAVVCHFTRHVQQRGLLIPGIAIRTGGMVAESS